MDMPSIYVAIQHAVTVLDEKVQALKANEKLTPEQRRTAELAYRRQFISGMQAIEENLSLAIAFTEQEEAA